MFCCENSEEIDISFMAAVLYVHFVKILGSVLINTSFSALAAPTISTQSTFHQCLLLPSYKSHVGALTLPWPSCFNLFFVPDTIEKGCPWVSSMSVVWLFPLPYLISYFLSFCAFFQRELSIGYSRKQCESGKWHAGASSHRLDSNLGCLHKASWGTWPIC